MRAEKVKWLIGGMLAAAAIGCGDRTSGPPENVREASPQALIEDASDYVATPFGLHHRSCVHRLEAGARLERNRVIRRKDGTSLQARACPYQRRRAQAHASVPSEDHTKWVEYAQTHAVSASEDYTLVSGDWVVPSAPIGAYSGSQTYFTFLGLRGVRNGGCCREPDSSIYQPVLQYGTSAAGGGSFWGIASWWCGDGTCFFSTLIAVSPGHSIRGTITGACGPLDCAYTVTTRNQTTGQQTVLSSSDEYGYKTAVGGAVEVVGLTACNQYPNNGAFYSNIAMAVNGTPVGPGWLGWLTTVGNPTPSCNFGVVTTNATVGLQHNPWITASGGLTATCTMLCTPYIKAVTATGSNVITIKDNANHTGTITLSGGVTATGGLTASCGFCTPRITEITATGGNTITIRDNGGHVATLTLSGAKATGGLIANCGGGCSTPGVTGVTTSNGYLQVSDNGGNNATVFFSP